MKPFLVNSNSTVRRLTLPIQFMRFGVEDQEIVVPIRRREKETTNKVSANKVSALSKPPEPPSAPSADLP